MGIVPYWSCSIIFKLFSTQWFIALIIFISCIKHRPCHWTVSEQWTHNSVFCVFDIYVYRHRMRFIYALSFLFFIFQYSFFALFFLFQFCCLCCCRFFSLLNTHQWLTTNINQATLGISFSSFLLTVVIHIYLWILFNRETRATYTFDIYIYIYAAVPRSESMFNKFHHSFQAPGVVYYVHDICLHVYHFLFADFHSCRSPAVVFFFLFSHSLVVCHSSMLHVSLNQCSDVYKSTWFTTQVWVQILRGWWWYHSTVCRGLSWMVKSEMELSRA